MPKEKRITGFEVRRGFVVSQERFLEWRGAEGAGREKEEMKRWIGIVWKSTSLSRHLIVDDQLAISKSAGREWSSNLEFRVD